MKICQYLSKKPNFSIIISIVSKSNLGNIRLRRTKSLSADEVRHSLAHLLAAAVLEKFSKAKLGIGPTIENGFYYDFLLPRALTPEDLNEFERAMRGFIKDGLPFSGKKVN